MTHAKGSSEQKLNQEDHQRVKCPKIQHFILEKALIQLIISKEVSRLGSNKTIPINQRFRGRQGERKGDDGGCGLENGPLKSWHLSCNLSTRNAHCACWYKQQATLILPHKRLLMDVAEIIYIDI